jgi:hypothetical protein
LTNASEQRAHGGDGALSFTVVCAFPSLTPTLRVHRHRAILRLLSRCAPSFCGRRPRLFEFTRPLPRLGRGPQCVPSGVSTLWAGCLRHHASDPAGAHTSSVGHLRVTLMRTKVVWMEWTNTRFPSRSSSGPSDGCRVRERASAPTCDVARSKSTMAAVGKTGDLIRATPTFSRARNAPYLERRALAPPQRAAA